MNRRGFFGAIAGAFVGGTFRRLAPAPAPPTVDPSAFYGIDRGVAPPGEAFLEAAIAEMDRSAAALRADLVARFVACDFAYGDHSAAVLLERQGDGTIAVVAAGELREGETLDQALQRAPRLRRPLSIPPADLV